jgi:hypothetical protein
MLYYSGEEARILPGVLWRTLCIHHRVVPSRHYMGETRNYRGQLKGST